MASKKMRVVYVDESHSIGGAEEYLKMLLRGFSNRFDIVLIHRDSRDHNRFYADLGISEVTVKSEVYDKPYRLLKSYLAIFKKNGSGLLHVNLPAPNYCRSAITAATVCGLPGIVATSHLPNLTFPRSTLGMLAGRSIWDWMVWRGVFNMIDASIVVSQASANSLVKNYPAAPGSVKCIHNGVDLSRFSKAERTEIRGLKRQLGISEDDLVVTSIGRLHPQKGYSYLLEAMRTISRKVPNVRLVLVGDGPLRDELFGLTTDYRLQDRVIFAGKRDDIPTILAASDIYVNSSIFEGLPFSILEAMAAGVPVVATAVDGNSEIMTDADSGIVVAPENVEELAKAITALADDANRRRIVGMKGREVVEKRFSIDLMLRKTEQLYCEVACATKMPCNA